MLDRFPDQALLANLRRQGKRLTDARDLHDALTLSSAAGRD